MISTRTVLPAVKVDGALVSMSSIVLATVKIMSVKDWLEVAVLVATLALLSLRIYFVIKTKGKDPAP